MNIIKFHGEFAEILKTELIASYLRIFNDIGFNSDINKKFKK